MNAVLGLTLAATAAGLLAAHRHRRHDVQDRTHMRELEAHARRFRLLADALPMMTAYVDAEGRIQFCNLASEDWFERPRAELEGEAVDKVLPPEIYSRVRESIEMAQGGERVDFDLAVGGTEEGRRLSAILVPHTDEAGRGRGFFAFGQNVTEGGRLQEELHRQHDQLAHATRLATLGEMATALAHELNQPLTAVLGNAQAALRLYAASSPSSVTVPDDVQETLADIAHDAARAGEIIRRLRDLIRKDESKRAPLDVNQAIRGVERVLRAAALENDVALSLDLAPNLTLCLGDAIQIQQVVLNLVRNGMEAMRSVPEPERRMVVRTWREKEGVVVSVEDAGPPVSQDVLDRLFMPFYSTKEDGLGMGLSISRSIVEAHHGSIEARRGGARGLVLRFSLPTAPSRAKVGAPGMSA